MRYSICMTTTVYVKRSDSLKEKNYSWLQWRKVATWSAACYRGQNLRAFFRPFWQEAVIQAMKYRFKLANPNKNTTRKQARLSIEGFMSLYRPNVTPLTYHDSTLNMYIVILVPNQQFNFKIEILVEFFFCSKLLCNNLSRSTAQLFSMIIF